MKLPSTASDPMVHLGDDCLLCLYGSLGSFNNLILYPAASEFIRGSGIRDLSFPLCGLDLFLFLADFYFIYNGTQVPRGYRRGDHLPFETKTVTESASRIQTKKAGSAMTGET